MEIEVEAELQEEKHCSLEIPLLAGTNDKWRRPAVLTYRNWFIGAMIVY